MARLFAVDFDGHIPGRDRSLNFASRKDILFELSTRRTIVGPKMQQDQTAGLFRQLFCRLNISLPTNDGLRRGGECHRDCDRQGG